MTEGAAPIKGETNEHAPMTITVARAHRGADSITKTVIVAADGKRSMKAHEWESKAGELKRGPVLPCAKWDMAEHIISSADDAWDLLERLTDPARASCILRGRLPDGVTAMQGAQRLALHLPRSSNIVAFDLDAVPVKPGMEAAPGEAIGAVLLDAMPAPWKAADCFVQLTAGHGVKPGWRVRLWFVTRRALSSRDLEVMFGPDAPVLALPWCAAPVPFDKSVWASNQCNYIASPLVRTAAGEPAQDHVKERWVVIRGAGDGIVDVPSAAEIEEQRVALAMPEHVEREWPVSAIPPDKIDGPGVRGAVRRMLASAPPLLDAGGRRKAAALMLFRMMHAGMSAHGSDDAGGALAALLDWACAERTDPATGEVTTNVAFDDDCSPDSLESYLREALEGKWFDGIIGRDYKPEWEPEWEPDYMQPGAPSSFPALPPDELAAESGTAPADAERVFSKRLRAKVGLRRLSDPRRPRLPWIFEGAMPDGKVGLIVGQTRAGKSFIAMRAAAALATGQAFMGFQNVGGASRGVAYFASEAGDTVEERMDALASAGLASTAMPLLISELADANDLDAALDLAACTMRQEFGTGLAVAFVDTLATMFRPQDENANGEMGNLVTGCADLARKHGLTVVLVHHAGKMAGSGARGASAVTANADWQWTVQGATNEETGVVSGRTLSLTKTRRGQTGPLTGFDLVEVEVGRDAATGQPVKAAYAVPVVSEQAAIKRPAHHGAILAALAGGPMARAALQEKVADAAAVTTNVVSKAVTALLDSGKLVAGAGKVVRLAPDVTTGFLPVTDDDAEIRAGAMLH